MLEVEIKAKVKAPERIKEQLLGMGAKVKDFKVNDWYLTDPSRKKLTMTSDAVLRIRERALDHRKETRVTYKGGIAKGREDAREEIEFTTDCQLMKILDRIGFDKMLQKTKTGWMFYLEGIEISLTRVVGRYMKKKTDLGWYIEIEKQAQKNDYDKARNAIMKLAEKMGIRPSEIVREHFRQTIMKKVQKHG